MNVHVIYRQLNLEEHKFVYIQTDRGALESFMRTTALVDYQGWTEMKTTESVVVMHIVSHLHANNREFTHIKLNSLKLKIWVSGLAILVI